MQVGRRSGKDNLGLGLRTKETYPRIKIVFSLESTSLEESSTAADTARVVCCSVSYYQVGNQQPLPQGNSGQHKWSTWIQEGLPLQVCCFSMRNIEGTKTPECRSRLKVVSHTDYALLPHLATMLQDWHGSTVSGIFLDFPLFWFSSWVPGSFEAPHYQAVLMMMNNAGRTMQESSKDVLEQEFWTCGKATGH